MEPLELRGDTCPDRGWHEGRGRPVVWAWTGWACWQPGCHRPCFSGKEAACSEGGLCLGRKTFRNYFLKHNSSVSCFYDLELPREPLGSVNPRGGARTTCRHCGWQPERWRSSVPTALALGTAVPKGQARCRGRGAESDREVCGGRPPRSLAEASRGQVPGAEMTRARTHG